MLYRYLMYNHYLLKIAKMGIKVYSIDITHTIEVTIKIHAPSNQETFRTGNLISIAKKELIYGNSSFVCCQIINRQTLPTIEKSSITF